MNDYTFGFVSGFEVGLGFMASIVTAIKRDNAGLISVVSGPVLHTARNDLAKMFMQNVGGRVDTLVMVDTDIVFSLKHLDALLAHDESVVRGIYPNAVGEPVTEGCGFVAIKRRVFHNLGSYPFNPVELSDGRISGEDVGFYARCRKEGIEVVTDTDIKVGHMKPQVLTLEPKPEGPRSWDGVHDEEREQALLAAARA